MAEGAHVMIAEARFYEEIADRMMESVLEELRDAGASWESFRVPGTFELPGAIGMAVGNGGMSDSGKAFDGYVALGCVIRGETTHYDYVCQESARGLNDLVLEHRIALGYGVLTTENRAQAEDRARRDRHDRGGAAARACLAMIALRGRFLRQGPR